MYNYFDNDVEEYVAIFKVYYKDEDGEEEDYQDTYELYVKADDEEDATIIAQEEMEWRAKEEDFDYYDEDCEIVFFQGSKLQALWECESMERE